MAKIRFPQRRIERIKSMGGGGGNHKDKHTSAKGAGSVCGIFRGSSSPPPGNAITNDSRQNVSVDV